MIGDAAGGGSAPEAVLPLNDPQAMKAVASAIAEHLGGGGSDAKKVCTFLRDTEGIETEVVKFG